MDVSQITEGINQIGLIAYALVATIGFGAAVYKAIRNWRGKQSLNVVVENTANALNSTIAGIEAAKQLYKSNPAVIAKIEEVEKVIKSVSIQVGAEGSGLNEAVKLIKGLLPEQTARDREEQIRRAVLAVQKAREIKAESQKSTIKKAAGLLGGLFVALFLLCSCACPQRFTSETAVVAPDGQVMLVVEWPESVAVDDVMTIETEGRAESLAPLVSDQAPVR